MSGRCPITDDDIHTAILSAVTKRGAGKSICPSEPARALSHDWRALMPDVRRVAGAMTKTGLIVILQRGKTVDPDTARGPIRLACPPGNTSA